MLLSRMKIVSSLAIAGIVATGCGWSSERNAAPAPATQVSEHQHGHEGWWCDEHGVPEDVCSRCNVKLAANFKAKGDWCQKHDLPDSQCFVCHPEREAEFAAQYEAKYGQKPPRPSDQ